MKNIYLAVDLGSTTIDTCLLSVTGEIICQKSFKNRQSLYGSDVINRIMTAVRDSSYVKIMKNIVLTDICVAVTEMLDMHREYAFDNILRVCISGNTTMISILLEYDLESLGKAPFTAKLKESVIVSANELFKEIDSVSFNQGCRVYLTGCASAFIGGDILAGIKYLRTNGMMTDTDVSLLMDLGTNGEMVLNAYGKYYATSCACGPAFESALRKQKVFGANLIDAISLAVKTKKISDEGILCSEYFEKGLDIMDVHLDMDIIRQVLPAKAAVITAVTYLFKHAYIPCEQVDTVYLAGGFGFYLSPSNAISIGMLPLAFENKIKVVGNTSLKGAITLLCDSDYAGCIIDRSIEVLQLANEPDYQDVLINNMNFKSKEI